MWRAAYELVIRGVAAVIGRAEPGVAVYVKGSLARGQALYGISDIDFVAVAPADDEGRGVHRLAKQWRRLLKLFPPLRYVAYLYAYDEHQLARAASASCFTFGLSRSPNEAAFLGASPVADELGLLERPAPGDPVSGWRRIRGPERRPPVPSPDPQDDRLAAWLELQFWSRYLFAACASPDASDLSSLCVKLVAEPARILLKLRHGEEVRDRSAALERARSCFPEEGVRLGLALELAQALHREPQPPLADAIEAFFHLSSLVADEFRRSAEGAGYTEVALSWGGSGELILPDGGGNLRELGGTSELPLVDWRAIVLPTLPDEAFALVEGDATSPAFLAHACKRGTRRLYPALRFEHLLVLPAAANTDFTGGTEVQERSARFRRVKLRGLQCAQMDPVSFALLSGGTTAAFVQLRGIAAADVARRAVAEHRAWLELPLNHPAPAVRPWVDAQLPSNATSSQTLARLLTAARAAFFLESLENGVPSLALTVAAVARALGEAGEGAIGEEAAAAYHAAVTEGTPPESSTVVALRDQVLRMTPYRG